MKFKLILLLSNIWWCIYCQKASDICIPLSTLPYYSLQLKNNYRLIVATVGKDRILNLTGPGIDTVLKRIEFNASDKYIGWLMADYEDVFVLFYPEEQVKVFKKQSGAAMISGQFIEIDKDQNVLYYIDNDQGDKLGLFHLLSGKVDLLNPPETACEKWWICIKSKSLSKNALILDYLSFDHSVKNIL